jgi:MoxR-like ATPase
MEAPKPAPKPAPKISCEQAFGMVTEWAAKRKAHLQINQHVRAVSGKQNIALYHNDASIPEEAKIEVYKECFAALHADNYSKLKGQEKGKGDKRIDPIDEAVAPATTPKPPQRTPEAAPSVPQPQREVKPPTPTDEAEAAMELTKLLRRLRGNGPAEVDPSQVESIIAERIALFESEYDKALADKIKKHVSNGSFPADKVKELVIELTSKMAHRFEFVSSSSELKALDGLVHPQVSQIATWLRAGVPVWAWSAAGSGKTHMARQIAKLLEVEAQVVSVDPTLTVAKLMGYRNVANGDFVEGFIYNPYRKGGLLALDEVDTGDPGVIASANALLSNTEYLFPNNETVVRNERFYCLAMANTKGMGAVTGYTARNRLDAATLDRFAVIEIKYDAGLETALACGEGVPAKPWQPAAPASQKQQKAYVEWVQKVRATFGDSILISPRASINGCKALRAGVPMAEVVEALVFKLCTTDTVTRIKKDCGIPT